MLSHVPYILFYIAVVKCNIECIVYARVMAIIIYLRLLLCHCLHPSNYAIPEIPVTLWLDCPGRATRQQRIGILVCAHVRTLSVGRNCTHFYL